MVPAPGLHHIAVLSTDSLVVWLQDKWLQMQPVEVAAAGEDAAAAALAAGAWVSRVNFTAPGGESDLIRMGQGVVVWCEAPAMHWFLSTLAAVRDSESATCGVVAWLVALSNWDLLRSWVLPGAPAQGHASRQPSTHPLLLWPTPTPAVSYTPCPSTVHADLHLLQATTSSA